METSIITGSSNGLGSELAKEYVRVGNKVILHGRNRSRLEILSRQIDAPMIIGDLSDDLTIRRIIQEAKKNNVTCLINNAAVYFNGTLENEAEYFDSILATNLIAPIKLIQGIFPIFKQKKYGTIVNIMSIDAKMSKGYQTAYSVSKSGLMGFTDSLRFEAKDNNIRVVGVYLGGMDTEMYKQGGKSADKCMDPAEVAQIIVELAKNHSNKTGVDDIVINRQKY